MPEGLGSTVIEMRREKEDEQEIRSEEIKALVGALRMHLMTIRIR